MRSREARGRRMAARSHEICSLCDAVMSPPAIDVVTTHYLEPLDWVLPVLSDNQRTHVIIYECGVRALPPAVRRHPRIMLRDKSGELAQRDPFWSVYDHIVRSYASLAADYVLFVHGHETHYHRSTPTRSVLEQCYRLVTQRQVGFVNVGDAVHSAWMGCRALSARRGTGTYPGGPDGLSPSDRLCSEAAPCPSMRRFLNDSWRLLAHAFGRAELAPPTALAEINGNEALVHRCRLLARPVSFWIRLRELTAQHHSLLAFALEGSFHRVMGEPWVRPYVSSRHPRINFVACDRNASVTLWPGSDGIGGGRGGGGEFDQQWRDHTELSLRATEPNDDCLL